MASLSVYLPPGLTTQPQNQSVGQGTNASFSVAASGSAPLSYQWSFNGAALSGATASTLTISGAQTSNAGSYTVAVANSWGAITSAVASLSVYLAPGLSTQPQNQSVGQGTNASFSVAASGSAPLSYQWSFNGAALSGATASTLTIPGAQTNSAGSYTVAVANSWGAITSAVATLSVLVPAGIVSQPQSQTVTVGQNATFSVTACGTGTLSYQWSCNGTPLFGTTNYNLTLNPANLTNSGNYSVVVTNIVGSVTSAVASLTVTNPSVTLSVTGGAAMTPAGFTFQFSVPVGLTYIILSSTDLRAWTPIATNVATTGTIIFTDTGATNYMDRLYQVSFP